MKLIILLFLLIVFFSVSFPAEASLCRYINEQTICILSIKRSAKNYWEYRASVKIDNTERPIEVYNCRDRIITQKDGTVIPFESNHGGELICRFFSKK